MQSQQRDLRKRDTPMSLADITVPLNNGASGTFPPIKFSLPNLNPTQYASFYAFGGTSASWITSAPSSIITTSGSQTLTLSAPGGAAGYTLTFSGAGNRSTIYGSARWGSGDGTVERQAPRNFIPNERLDNSDRGYPYGFWPIYWGSINYGMSGKFGFTPSRPGGEQNLLIAGLNETRQDAYYFVTGDAYTIKGLNIILALPYEQGGCAMWSGNPVYLFEPDTLSPSGTRTLRSATGPRLRQNITIIPQNVLQYYRASSVALGANVYLNEFSLNDNRRPEYWGRTPFNVSVMLPSNITGGTSNTGVNHTLQETRFLDCLNQTIAAAAPIVDGVLLAQTQSPTQDDNASKIGIGVGVTLAVVAILLICCWRYKSRSSAHSGRAPFRPGGPTSARIIIDDHSMHIPMSVPQPHAHRPEAEESLPVYVPPLADGAGEQPPPYVTGSNDRITPGEVQTRG